MQHIESLESRELLSAAHPAAKTKPTKPTIPNIVGSFTGTSQETKPLTDSESLTLTFATESAKGALTGSYVTVQGSYTITGTVTTKDKFTLKLLHDGKSAGSAAGVYNTTSHDITGTFKATRIRIASGIFSLSPAVTG